MKATAKDLRFHARELMESVARGEEVIITFRGKPRAKLVPYEESREKQTETALFGIWKEREDMKDVDAYVRGLRHTRYPL